MLRVILLMTLSAIVLDVLAADVKGLRLWRAPDSTRLVFDLSAPVEHKLFTLANPGRVVIDMEGVSLPRQLDDVALADTPIDSIRYGQRETNALRVVLDLKHGVTPRSFVLKKHGDKPDRLVIDLDDADKPNLSKPTVVKQALPSSRDIVIAIDAGHGGEDPGAIGPKGIREKDVVLEISRNLVRMINKEPGYKSYLVRTGDYYIPLRSRRNKARELRADLFVSIHADAFKNPKAHGASVFALSRRGATSESARFLASKENEADLIGGVGGVSLDDKDDVLAGVLVDLSMTATLTNSLNVGDKVLKQLGKVARLHKRQVEQAGFAVLKSPDVPSILVETGFISNPHEASKLSTRSYRKYLASAIFNGIKDYFEELPPAGTMLAERLKKVRPVEYTIVEGDTLSDIAKRYNVSVRSILEHNQLSSSIIRSGQRIKIPTS